MKMYIIIAIGILNLLLITAGLSFVAGNYAAASESMNIFAVDPLNSEKLTRIVNDWRVSQNLMPYKESDLACTVAKVRLYETKENFSHDGFIASRFCETCTFGENLAQGYFSEEDTLQGWLESSGHKANLEAKYTHSCIVTEGNHAVQIFSYK